MEDLCGDPFLDFALPPGQGLCKPLHGHFAVLELGTALRSLSDDAGREMTDPYSGIGDVSVLSAWTGAPVEFDLQIGFLNLDSHACLLDRILLVDM